MFLGAVVATVGRFEDADLSSAWYSGSFSILIPFPNSSTNIGALIEPMSTNVIQTITCHLLKFLDDRCFLTK